MPNADDPSAARAIGLWRRVSFAVDYDTVVEPLPQFVTAEQPAAYNRIVAGQHLAGFSVNACKHLRRRIRAGDLAIDLPIHRKNPFKREGVDEFEEAMGWPGGADP